MVNFFALSFLALFSLLSLSACNNHFTGENINPYPLGTPSKVVNPNCSNSPIRQPIGKEYTSAEYSAWFQHMRNCQ